LDISFVDKKFEKQCNQHRLLVQKQGPNRANKIRQRLDDFRAANSLEDMRFLGGRCHELKGNKSGQLSLDLDHPYRLIFVPGNDPIPRKEDGGLDWNQITSILIIGIEDTHD
jgi:plasmid maintenance system killer protein